MITKDLPAYSVLFLCQEKVFVIMARGGRARPSDRGRGRG